MIPCCVLTIAATSKQAEKSNFSQGCFVKKLELLLFLFFLRRLWLLFRRCCCLLLGLACLFFVYVDLGS